MRPRHFLCLLLAGLFAGLAVPAADWPQFLGPNRDGTTPEPSPRLAPEPRPVWQLPAGSGFAGPVVAGGRAYLFQRRKNDEVLTCVESATGKTVWEHSRPTDYEDDFGFDNGPRAVPAVANGRVFTFGAHGLLLARAVGDGQPLWEFDARKEVGAAKGFFGFACSPLVVGELVLVNLGGPAGAGVAALAVDSGKIRWQLTDHEAGYASPVAASLGGRPTGLFFTREGLVGVELATGRERFSHPWRARMSASVNAASPLVLGDQIFLTSSYRVGAILLDCAGAKPRVIWSGDEALSAHYPTPVRHGELLFGFHGRQEQRPALRCVDWKTGQVRWSETGFGAGTLALAGAQLVMLREDGELVIAPAVATGFKPTRRAQVLGSNRAAFALADGHFYGRDKKHWVAVDLRAP
jgi:outer membrane protein assembly factor BamB